MKNATNMKSFNVRLTKELWVFLKKEAANQEKSMADLIQISVEKFKKKCEKKELTDIDADV